MRIELNAGGLSGLVAIAEFGFSINALDNDIDSMISSFQAVKNAVNNLEGGIGNLGEAVDSLQKRIFTEEKKKQNLSDFGNRFNDFLDLTVAIDKDAAQLVRRNKEEFYRVNEHLRPVIAEDDGWHPFKALGEALYGIGEFIVETIVEIGDEIFVIYVTVLAISGGIALIFVTGGAFGVILGCALVGGGLGMLVTGIKTYNDDGDVDVLETVFGFGIGFTAGAAIGTCIYGAGYIAAAYKGLGGYLSSQALQGAGTSMGMDFFTQIIIKSDDIVAGLENYDIMDTLYNGVKGAFTSMAVGYVFKFSGISDKISKGTGGFIGKYIQNHDAIVNVISKVPANAIEGIAEGFVDRGFDVITGNNEESFGWKNIVESVAFNVLFGAVTDSVEFKILKKRQADEIAARVHQNIEESRIAREASNFGAGGLSYREYPISSKGIMRLLEQRGLTTEQAQEVIESFNKFSPYRDMSLGQGVTVSHTPTAGEIRYIYSTNRDASGIFTTPDWFIDNRTGIGDLATPTSNAMLNAEKVIIYGDKINGTVAPQPLFTIDAAASGTDDVIRRGGGNQTVTNGGLNSGAVRRTGEIRRLFDTANRVKLLFGTT